MTTVELAEYVLNHDMDDAKCEEIIYKAIKEVIKENLKVSVSTDFNECNGDTVTVKFLLKNKEGEFETIDKSTAYLT